MRHGDVSKEQTVNFTTSISGDLFTSQPYSAAAGLTSWTDGQLLKRILGNKEYELTNHLSNVLEVVSDKRLGGG